MYAYITVMILNFRTDKSGQTVQTQIRLLLEEQSDQGLHCLLFHLHQLTKYPTVWPLCLNFRQITVKFSGVRKFRNLTVVFPCYSGTGALRVRGFDPHSGLPVVYLSKIHLQVITRRRWLLPDITEKLLTGM